MNNKARLSFYLSSLLWGSFAVYTFASNDQLLDLSQSFEKNDQWLDLSQSFEKFEADLNNLTKRKSFTKLDEEERRSYLVTVASQLIEEKKHKHLEAFLDCGLIMNISTSSEAQSHFTELVESCIRNNNFEALNILLSFLGICERSFNKNVANLVDFFYDVYSKNNKNTLSLDEAITQNLWSLALFLIKEGHKASAPAKPHSEAAIGFGYWVMNMLNNDNITIEKLMGLNIIAPDDISIFWFGESLFMYAMNRIKNKETREKGISYLLTTYPHLIPFFAKDFLKRGDRTNAWHIVAFDGDVELARLLAKHKPFLNEINALNCDYQTPLDICIQQNHGELEQILRDLGAETSQPIKNTPLSIGIESSSCSANESDKNPDSREIENGPPLAEETDKKPDSPRLVEEPRWQELFCSYCFKAVFIVIPLVIGLYFMSRPFFQHPHPSASAILNEKGVQMLFPPINGSMFISAATLH